MDWLLFVWFLVITLHFVWTTEDDQVFCMVETLCINILYNTREVYGKSRYKCLTGSGCWIGGFTTGIFARIIRSHVVGVNQCRYRVFVLQLEWLNIRTLQTRYILEAVFNKVNILRKVRKRRYTGAVIVWSEGRVWPVVDVFQRADVQFSRWKPDVGAVMVTHEVLI